MDDSTFGEPLNRPRPGGSQRTDNQRNSSSVLPEGFFYLSGTPHANEADEEVEIVSDIVLEDAWTISEKARDNIPYNS